MAAIDWDAWRNREAARLGLNFKPFQPYVPVAPPGSYDPSLNAQEAAAQRGYRNTFWDTVRGDQRGAEDLGIGREALTRNYNRGGEDLATGYNRGNEDLVTNYGRSRSDLDLGYQRNTSDLDLGYQRGTSDLGTARSRGIEDYDWQVGALQRGYKQLERRQDEGARRSGVLSGGLALKSAAARAENMAFDRHPMDVQQTRFLTDNTQSQNRLTQDYGTNRGRLTEDYTTTGNRLGEDFTRTAGRANEDYARGTARLGEDYTTAGQTLSLAYARGGEDRATALARAGRENEIFGQDVETQRLYQAGQANLLPAGPKGEGVTAAGTPYREVTKGGYIWRYDQKGNLLGRRKA